MSSEASSKVTALVAIADATEEMEAVIVIDVLRRANVLVTVASVMASKLVTCSRGVKIEADVLIDEVADATFDLVYAPGGNPGAAHLGASATFLAILDRHIKEDLWVGAICAAPVLVLARNGLLGQRKATCHPSFVQELPNATSADSRIVIDSKVVTSRGPGTTMEFAIKLVELLCGAETARTIGTAMVMDTVALEKTLGTPFLLSPFHHAFPVANLDQAREFYGGVLQLTEGRSSERWIDYSLFGHQIVCHLVHSDFKAVDYFNPVDKDEVPVPHFGVCLNDSDFTTLADRLKAAGVSFVIEPTLRFAGAPGEQKTMFLKDPFNNNLEFKSMSIPANLFARYFVAQK